MALIKGSDAGGMAGHRSLTLHDLKEQADRVLADAATEAQRIVDEARNEAQTEVEAAARRGFAEGRDRGRVEGREVGTAEGRAEAIETYSAQLRATLTAWSEMLTDWETRRLAMLAAAREDVLMLALAMGEKVAHRIIEVDPAVVVDQVDAALELVVGASTVTVSVNPDDRPFLESVLQEIVTRIGQCAHVELRDDSAVGRGGCTLSTGLGRIDATVERQIDRIVETLLGSTARLRSRRNLPRPPGGEQPDAENEP